MSTDRDNGGPRLRPARHLVALSISVREYLGLYGGSEE